MEFMKPKAARVLPPMMSNNSHSVNIICEESVQYSLVSHLSAALRREGISVFVDSCGFQETKPFSVEQNQAVTDGARVSVVVISNMVELFDPWVLKFLKVIKRRRNSGHMVVPVFYGVDPLNRVYGWANRRLEAEKLTSHQSRYIYIFYSTCVSSNFNQHHNTVTTSIQTFFFFCINTNF